jgi:glycosyltransferase involved in cell wall biosynthesis
MRIGLAGLKGIPATYGGVERAVEEIGARLASRGHDVTVFCRRHYTPKTASVHRGMRLLRLPSLETRRLDTLSHTGLSAIRCSVERLDVVHLHSLGNAPFIPWFRLGGARVVMTLHGLEWVQEKWRGTARAYFKACERPAVFWPDAVTSVSQHWGEDLVRRLGRPVRYIPNGVSIQKPQAPDLIGGLGLAPRGYLLFLARLVPEKGAHYLIDAFRGLRTGMRLVVAGGASDGSAYAASLRRQAAGDPRILFTGFVFGDLWRELLSHSYLTVHPSESEGLSMGLLEAMAFSNAVLTSDIPENLEVIGEDAGARFRCRDVEDLRRQLADLLASPERVASLRSLAVDRVRRRFDWDRIVDAYEEVLSMVLTSSQRRAGGHQ